MFIIACLLILCGTITPGAQNGIHSRSLSNLPLEDEGVRLAYEVGWIDGERLAQSHLMSFHG